MKTKTFYVMIFLFIIYSCNNDNDVSNVEPDSDLALNNLVILNSTI